jgi:hypothetical protein
MSAQVLSFPIQTASQKYLVQSVRAAAARSGMDVKATEREFIAAGCTKEAQNRIWERARRMRMAVITGSEA